MIQEIIEPSTESGETRQEIVDYSGPAIEQVASNTTLEQKNGPVQGYFKKKEQRRTIEKKELFIRGIIELEKWSVENVCNYAGINKDTYYDWIKKDLIFDAKVNEANEVSSQIRLQRLREELKEKDLF